MNRSTDRRIYLVTILASERNFNGFADPMITADRGYIQFWGPDFGFWLLGSSRLFFFSRICKILFRYRHWSHKYFVDSHPQR